MKKIPRLLISGTNSGCGKTTVTIALLKALVKRNLKVQPFKVGPDYIDPMFHTFVTKVNSYNLDSWLLNEDTVSKLFHKHAQGYDIAIIEGVMGLFDGFGGTSTLASSAHISKITKTPIILVINGEGMSTSISAIINGFENFDKNINLGGIIINNLKSKSHFLFLKEIITGYTQTPVLGYLEKNIDFSLDSRHLGLIPSCEIDDLKTKINSLSKKLEETVDIKKLIDISKNAPPIQQPKQDLSAFNIFYSIKKRPPNKNIRIAAAKDQAFNFYYKDNLEILESLGANIIFFSPLAQEKLPKNIDGLYLPGGYPEVYAKTLEENTQMKHEIKECIKNGLPTIAECGGLIYLSKNLINTDSKKYEMVGVLPLEIEMTQKLNRFGYIEIEVLEDNILTKKGNVFKAHEFHYSKIKNISTNINTVYKVTKKRNGKQISTWTCGYKLQNLLAAYAHIHFGTNPVFAKNFINNCHQKNPKNV